MFQVSLLFLPHEVGAVILSVFESAVTSPALVDRWASTEPGRRRPDDSLVPGRTIAARLRKLTQSGAIKEPWEALALWVNP